MYLERITTDLQKGDTNSLQRLLFFRNAQARQLLFLSRFTSRKEKEELYFLWRREGRVFAIHSPTSKELILQGLCVSVDRFILAMSLNENPYQIAWRGLNHTIQQLLYDLKAERLLFETDLDDRDQVIAWQEYQVSNQK
jgi:hypothetical protein